MPYKISGNIVGDPAKIIITAQKGDLEYWFIESKTDESTGSYEIKGLTSDTKIVTAIKSDGESLSYGNVTPTSYALTPGDRGVFAGGVGGAGDVIDYITISSTGDATDFGNLTAGRNSTAGCSNSTSDRGVFCGGNSSNVMDYITISTPSNAADFGDLPSRLNAPAVTSNGPNDRGIISGGFDDEEAGNDRYRKEIHYITISSAGNSTDFGNLSEERYYLTALSNDLYNRGVIAGGSNWDAGRTKVIEYVNISSLGNATFFGNLTLYGGASGGCSNGTSGRGCFMGAGTAPKNTIDYITISTTGDSTDFGDLITGNDVYISATSNGVNDRAVGALGYSVTDIIQYITISSTGNATDFGDLTVARYYGGAASNA